MGGRTARDGYEIEHSSVTSEQRCKGTHSGSAKKIAFFLQDLATMNSFLIKTGEPRA